MQWPASSAMPRPNPLLPRTSWTVTARVCVFSRSALRSSASLACSSSHLRSSSISCARHVACADVKACERGNKRWKVTGRAHARSWRSSCLCWLKVDGLSRRRAREQPTPSTCRDSNLAWRRRRAPMLSSLSLTAPQLENEPRGALSSTPSQGPKLRSARRTRHLLDATPCPPPAGARSNPTPASSPN